MKITMLLVFLLVVSTAVFGQIRGSVSSEAQPFSIPDHPRHADQGSLRPEQSLLSNGGVTAAQGERPLWEFPNYAQPVSLGDVARAFRKEHASMEKAIIIWEKQGK
jgi:hypothetical protein